MYIVALNLDTLYYQVNMTVFHTPYTLGISMRAKMPGHENNTTLPVNDLQPKQPLETADGSPNHTTYQAYYYHDEPNPPHDAQ